MAADALNDSDIARIVHSYLESEQLYGVAKDFRRKSRHLRSASLSRGGLKAYSLFPSLDDIVLDYCKISAKVLRVVNALPGSHRNKLRSKNVSGKVSYLLDLILTEICQVSSFASTRVQNDIEESVESRTKRKRSMAQSSEDESLPRHSNKKQREHYSDEGGSHNIESDSDSHSDGPLVESTPHRKISKQLLPEIFQAILESSEFQNKVANNINQALNPNPVTVTEVTASSSSVQAEVTNASKDVTISDGGLVTTSQELEDMIQRIVETTEKDPSLDAIIEEVLGVPDRSQVSAGVQCNILPNPNVITLIAPDEMSNVVPPQTPLVVRTASGGVPQRSVDLSVATCGNTSFGSLIDPNFSISKFINFNPPDSVLKNPQEANIGNTTADNIIKQLNAVGGDDQVCFDPSGAPVTLPLILTGDTLLANLPFLNSNEIIQLQNGAFVLPSNDLRRNPVIFSSAQKIFPQNQEALQQQQTQQSTQMPRQIPQSTQQQQSTVRTSPARQIQLVTEQQVQPQPSATQLLVTCSTQSLADTQRTANKFLLRDSGSVVSLVPSSCDSRINLERGTPATTGIVNVKAYRSLSTPRKRHSHVRTLNFSPKHHLGDPVAETTGDGGTPQQPSDATPLLTRPVSRLPAMQHHVPIAEEVSADTAEASPPNSNRPIINNVEIWPRLAVSSATLLHCDSANESSSNSNIPPLFVREESSNQTVIEKPLASKRVKSVPSMTLETPKRLQPRRAAKQCKRQLTKSPMEEEVDTEQDVIRQKGTQVEKTQGEGMACVVGNKDQDEMLQAWQRMRKNDPKDLDNRLRHMNAMFPNKVSHRRNRTKRRVKTPVQNKKQRKVADAEEAGLAELQRSLLEFYDDDAIDAERGDMVAKKEQLTLKESPEESQGTTTSASASGEKQDSDINFASKQATSINTGNTPLSLSYTEVSTGSAGSRDAKSGAPTNMAFLLETPFKEACLGSNFVPPTPSAMSAFDTPHSKAFNDEFMRNTHFLFGSLTKSELDMPLNPVTPGLPQSTQSRAADEVSPGRGSYYKPDESDNLDRNFDRMIKQTPSPTIAHSRRVNSSPTNQKTMREEESGRILENQMIVEISMEKLRVEPIILTRVKPKGDTRAAINPHYTMVSGLPDMSSAEENFSSPSTTPDRKKTENSSGSGKSSGFTSSSSSSASGNDSDDKEWQEAEHKSPEQSNLVRGDGEVRYPVRSWITPAKESPSETAKESSNITIVLPIKPSHEDHKRALDEKRLRVRNKLLEGCKTASGKSKSKNTVAEVVTASKSGAGKKKDASSVKQATENRTIEVLTALQLSAKKQPEEKAIAFPNCTVKLHRLVEGEIDDNACPNVFAKENITSLTTTSTKDEEASKGALPSGNKVTARKRAPKKSEPPKTKSPKCKIIIQPWGSLLKRSILDTTSKKKTSDKKDGEQKKSEKKNTKFNEYPSEITASTQPTNQAVANDKPKGKGKGEKKTSEKAKPQNHLTSKKANTTPKLPAPFPQKKATSKPGDMITAEMLPSKITVTNCLVSQPTQTQVLPPVSQLTPEREKQKNLDQKRPNTQTPDHNDCFAASSTSPPPTLPPPQNNTVLSGDALNTVKILSGDDEDYSDDYTPEDWDVVCITEDDSTRFFRMQYLGPDKAPLPQPCLTNELANYKMNVSVGKHKSYWTVSDTIVLFSSDPVPLTVPKKRKVHTQVMNDTTVPNTPPQRTTTKQEITAATPFTQSKESRSGVKETDSTKCDQSLIETVGDYPPSTVNNSNSDEKVEIDIELILSHLHGK